MSTMKLSYKSGRADRVGDSTVVVLGNGSVLEVRRGALTFSKKQAEKPQRWPSIEAWKATLPAGAAVVQEGTAAPAYADKERIARAFAGCGISEKNSLKFTPASKEEKLTKIRKTIEFVCSHIAKLEQGHYNARVERDPLFRKALYNDLALHEKFLREAPLTDRYDIVKKPGNIVLYGLRADDGSLEGIYVNFSRGKFAVAAEKPVIVDTLAELGFYSIWYRKGDRIMPLP